MKTAVARKDTPDQRATYAPPVSARPRELRFCVEQADITSLSGLVSCCPCDGGCPRCAPVIQPKLKIGRPDDKYEQEADRVAEQVMRMPEPAMQRKPTCSFANGYQRRRILNLSRKRLLPISNKTRINVTK